MTSIFGNNRPRLNMMHHPGADQTHHTWNHKALCVKKISKKSYASKKCSDQLHFNYDVDHHHVVLTWWWLWWIDDDEDDNDDDDDENSVDEDDDNGVDDTGGYDEDDGGDDDDDDDRNHGNS